MLFRSIVGAIKTGGDAWRMPDPTIWQIVEDKHLIGLTGELFEVLIHDGDAGGMEQVLVIGLTFGRTSNLTKFEKLLIPT